MHSILTNQIFFASIACFKNSSIFKFFWTCFVDTYLCFQLIKEQIDWVMVHYHLLKCITVLPLYWSWHSTKTFNKYLTKLVDKETIKTIEIFYKFSFSFFFNLFLLFFRYLKTAKHALLLSILRKEVLCDCSVMCKNVLFLFILSDSIKRKKNPSNANTHSFAMTIMFHFKWERLCIAGHHFFLNAYNIYIQTEVVNENL